MRALGVISALIVEKTPSQASAGAFPCNSPDVIAAPCIDFRTRRAVDEYVFGGFKDPQTKPISVTGFCSSPLQQPESAQRSKAAAALPDNKLGAFNADSESADPH